MIAIDDALPGGNIIVEGLDGDVLRLRQDLRDTEGHWFWWCCRVRGAAGRSLRVRLGDRFLLTAQGPACSTDGGATWTWLGSADQDGCGFHLAVPPQCQDLRLAMAIPYGADAWERFAATLPVRPTVLAMSPKGRTAPLAVLTPTGPVRHRLLLTARHHACESTASFALEGMVRAWLAPDDDDLAWIARHAELVVAPLMDADGVHDGDQGKSRRPYDHNRDYADAAPQRYPEVAALKALVRQRAASGAPITAAFDLHSPWILGPDNEHVFLVDGVEGPAANRALMAAIAAGRRGALPLLPDDCYPHGTGWNTFTGPPRTCSGWMRTQPGMVHATTVEVPYGVARGVATSVANLRDLGADLLRGWSRFLRERC